MLKTIISLSALLLSFGILCLGHGLQNTVLGLRAIYESYPDWIIGTMMSAYFVGFLFGTKFCGDLIPFILSNSAKADVYSVSALIKSACAPANEDSD